MLTRVLQISFFKVGMLFSYALPLNVVYASDKSYNLWPL